MNYARGEFPPFGCVRQILVVWASSIETARPKFLPDDRSLAEEDAMPDVNESLPWEHDAPPSPAADEPPRQPDLSPPRHRPSALRQDDAAVRANQACLDSGHDEFNLEFIPDDPETVTLDAVGLRFHLPRRRAGRHDWRHALQLPVFVQDRRNPEREHAGVMSVTDGQGGHLFAPGGPGSKRPRRLGQAGRAARVSNSNT